MKWICLFVFLTIFVRNWIVDSGMKRKRKTNCTIFTIFRWFTFSNQMQIFNRFPILCQLIKKCWLSFAVHSSIPWFSITNLWQFKFGFYLIFFFYFVLEYFHLFISITKKKHHNDHAQFFSFREIPWNLVVFGGNLQIDFISFTVLYPSLVVVYFIFTVWNECFDLILFVRTTIDTDTGSSSTKRAYIRTYTHTHGYIRMY